MERKVCFILDASREWGGVGRFLSKGWLPPTDNQWAGPLIAQGMGLHAETTQSASSTVIFKSVMGGLTRVILIVLGTVNLHFQDQFVSISLRPILGSVWLQSDHHIANFFHLVPVSVSINTRELKRYGSEYYRSP